MKTAPAWLTARPIAHRGLHNVAEGRAENSLSSCKAAIEQNYAIECDIRRAKDGEAMVFHDFTLERLTSTAGALSDFTSAELQSLHLLNTQDTIPSLADYLDTINGAVPLIIEIKSAFDGDTRLAARAAELIALYKGAVCLKSFDPGILIFLRERKVPCPMGLIAQAHYDASEWGELSPLQRQRLETLSDYPTCRPDFLSWHHKDFPATAPILFRHGLGLPVLAWTIRSGEERAAAEKWADQIIFEGLAV